MLGEGVEDVDLALLIHFHLIDRLLQLAQTNLVLVLQLHVLLFELGDVGQVELLVDDHPFLYDRKFTNHINQESNRRDKEVE